MSKLKQVVSRSHEFCYGHRVVGHEGKCKNLHGHNAQVKFVVESLTGSLDDVGRIIDFSVIKDLLCGWLEARWDHKMLLWDKDTIDWESRTYGIVYVPFNATAENMATYLLKTIGPEVLKGLPVRLTCVEFFETSKCSVQVWLDD